MYKKGLIESTDDNSEFLKASLIKNKDFEKANIIVKNNELINHDKKIFTEYLNQIQNCEEKIKLFQIIGYVSIVIFFALLLTKFSMKNEHQLKYFFLLIPAISATLNFTLSSNYFLKLKQLIEKEEDDIISNNNNKEFSIGNFLSYLSINFICLAICTYFILLSIKLENDLANVGLNIINIPLYISLGIIFFYFIFILPAFIMNKYYWGIFLFITYLANSIIFLVLLSMKLDNNSNYAFINIFIPLFITLGIHLIYSIFEIFKGENHIVLRLLYFTSILMILISTIYLAVNIGKNDVTLKIKIAIFYLISVVLLSIEKITNLLIFNDDEFNEKA